MKRFIGVDLHKTVFTVCYLGQNGQKETKNFKISQLRLFKETLRPEDEIAVEASTGTRFFVETIATLVKRVVIVNPCEFKVISASAKKTDKIDASTIAEFLSMNYLPAVRETTKEQAQIKSLVKTRSQLVKQRTSLINKLHNLLTGYGYVTSKKSFSSHKGLEAVKELNLGPLVNMETAILTDNITQLNKSIDAIEDTLKKPENHLPGHENITTIKGIGDISAATILSVIGNIDDFPNKKKLDSYFGIVPKIRISNNTEHYGSITKKGNKEGRTALVQCTLVAIKYNFILRAFYLKIKNKKGSGKAIIATSRKLLGLIYLTLKNNLFWDDSQLKKA
jgi:transposase